MEMSVENFNSNDATPDAVRDEDLEVCARVLNCLSKQMPQYKSLKRYRNVRKAIVPFTSAFENGLYNGAKDKQDYSRKRQKKIENQTRVKRKLESDRQKMNLRLLRRERIAKLQRLTQESDLPLIPDGAINTMNNSIKDKICVKVSNGCSSSVDNIGDANENDDILHNAKFCYICKTAFYKLHFFYATLCPTCSELNFSKREQLKDLTGKVALLTGARVKIGFQTGLKLLRAGSTVIATTRFPQDAALRYSKEPDFFSWCDRLHIYGLDLRNIHSVEVFCERMYEDFSRLDVIINNACQTIRRPPQYYQHLIDSECIPVTSRSSDIKKLLLNGSRFNEKLIQDSSNSNCNAILKACNPLEGSSKEIPSCPTSTSTSTVGKSSTATVRVPSLSVVTSQIQSTTEDKLCNNMNSNNTENTNNYIKYKNNKKGRKKKNKNRINVKSINVDVVPKDDSLDDIPAASPTVVPRLNHTNTHSVIAPEAEQRAKQMAAVMRYNKDSPLIF